MADNLISITEGYELPSKGSIYSKPVNSRVTIRSMTTMEDLKIGSPTNTPYKLLAEVIEDCLSEKPAIPVYDMCLGDYEYLLHKLRVVSYGPSYKVSHVCPRCGKLIDTKLDLESLKVNEFDLNKFKEARKIKLPVTGKEVNIHFQTPRMLDDIAFKQLELEKDNKNLKLDFKKLATLMLSINTVDNNVMSEIDKEEFVKKLPVKDEKAILSAIAHLNSIVGLDTRVNITCDKCGYDILTFFRFGPEFFSPSEE